MTIAVKRTYKVNRTEILTRTGQRWLLQYIVTVIWFQFAGY